MPAYGSIYNKSNVVTNLPSLPVPMTLGKVSCNCQFENSPTGSLEYNGILEQDLPALENAYEVGNEVTLYGVELMVSTYSYQREGYVYRDSFVFSVYQVTVSLESKYKYLIEAEVKVKVLAGPTGQVAIATLAAALKVPYLGPNFFITIPSSADKDYTTSLKSAVESHARIYGRYISYTKGIELKPLTAQGGWNFPAVQIINDGQNTLGYPSAYRFTELKGDYPVGVLTPPPPPFTAAGPVVEIIEESDEDPDLHPKNSDVLRTLDSCFDFSGPKKTKKITTIVNGTTESEEIWTYGFVFTAEDIKDSTGKFLLSNQLTQFWKIIQHEVTNYVYTSLPPVTLSVLATDPSNPNHQYPVLVKPGYQQYAQVGLFGGNITFFNSAKYLTEVIGTGHKLTRFKKEEAHNLITLDNSDPYYLTCKFFQCPLQSRIQYELKSSRVEYGDKIGQPFEIEWVDYNSLNAATKLLVNPYLQMNALGQVAILTPDPNYVEPMYISKETKETNSFAYTPDPETSLDDPYPPLITGEESYSLVERTILTPNKYSEKKTEFSSQDPGFSSSLEVVQFQEISGRPPDATHRQTTYTATAATGSSTTPKYRFFLISDFANFVNAGGSVSYAEATTLVQALLAAKTDLQIQDLRASQQTKTVTWFYPQIRDGDPVTTGSDRFAGIGQWCCTGVKWVLEYNQNSSFTSGPLVTCAGTELTLGLLRDRQVNYQMQVNPAASNGNPVISTTATGGNYSLGGSFPISQNRRKF